MSKKVKKRDGSLQDYAEEKVKDGLKKAGAAVDEAKDVAGKITSWVEDTAEEGATTSVKIGKKAIDLMKDVNEDVSVSFKKFFDKTPLKGKKTEAQK
jgi:hypothetical protein